MRTLWLCIVYIGETGRALETRIEEHTKDVETMEKKQYTRATRKESQSEINKSAITDHMNKYNHVAAWDDVKILGRESNKKSRWIKESIEIHKHDKTMNRDEGNYNLPHIYHAIIKKSTHVTKTAATRK